MSILLTTHRGATPASELNLSSLGAVLRIPANAHRLSGFRSWVLSEEFPEKLRITFLAGEISFDMSKEELQTHAAVKTEVCLGVGTVSKKSKPGQLYINGVLVTNEDANLSTNPDGVFVSRRSIRTGRVRLVPRAKRAGQYLELEGGPDWLLEIVSDSSVRKDTEQLRIAYHRAHVMEYWLIDARGEEILFQILLWRKSGYVEAPERNGWKKSRVFGGEFRLERQRNDLDLWEYTLLHRDR